jgi:glutaredoxin-related protein
LEQRKKFQYHLILLLIKSLAHNVDYNITGTRIFSSNQKLKKFISMRDQNQGIYQDNRVNNSNSYIYTKLLS